MTGVCISSSAVIVDITTILTLRACVAILFMNIVVNARTICDQAWKCWYFI
jgi:hypothetical protein